MWPSRRAEPVLRPGRPWSRTLGAAASGLLLLTLAVRAQAAVRFEVSGVVIAEDALDVRVDVRNTGDAPARPLTVVGELFGAERRARLETGIDGGQSASFHLSFPLVVPRPGVHAVPLLLEYPEGGIADAAGNLPMASQRAYLLLALGGTAEPAVKIDAPEMRLDIRGNLPVQLTSLDGQPHRVRLRTFTARGVRAEGPPLEVDVPARGQVASLVSLMRAGAPRGTRHGILLVAGTLDGPLERTTVAASIVEIAPDPGLLPALRRPLLVGAALLLVAAAALEVRRSRAATAP